MIIDKINQKYLDIIKESLKNYVKAWYSIPADINPDNIDIDRIRYIKNWETGAYIIEFQTEQNKYKELLSESELNLPIDQYKKLLDEQNKSGIELAKSILLHQDWYDYPVIWGTLDDMFDRNYENDYRENEKYSGDNYKDTAAKA